MSQDNYPLFAGLINHAKNSPVSFHVPGHKNGSVFPQIGNGLFHDLLKIDLTELSGLDDLHSANGIIREAEELTAQLYHVMKSYFLIGGSTAGNLAMILATCKVNDTVLVQRNSHKSIMHALRLANAKPIFLSPEYDYESQVSTNLSLATVKSALHEYSDVKALVLTTPNYYGMVSHELQEIIDLAHSFNIPVLVDEAHGAHFILGEPFPKSTTRLGADVVVQSAHKTLPAMTMGSYLHFNSTRINKNELEYFLQVVQSSSPSYPIMASLDLARYYLAHFSDEDKNNLINSISYLREKLASIPQLKLIELETDSYQADFLKITVQSSCSLTGYQLQGVLEEEQIYTELADPLNVLFVCPLAPLVKIDQLVEKIKKAVQHLPIIEKVKENMNSIHKVSSLSIAYAEMIKYKKGRIPIKEAEGSLAASSIIPYPPGIPLILQGETITRSHIDMLFTLKKAGAYFQNSDELWDKGIEVFL